MTKKILRRFGTIAVMLVGMMVLMAIFLPDASQKAYAASYEMNGVTVEISKDTDYGSWEADKTSGTLSVTTSDEKSPTSEKKIYIDIKPSLDYYAIISFDYTVSGNLNKINIPNNTVAKSGTAVRETSGRSYFRTTMKVKDGDGKNTLTISNIKVEMAKDVFHTADQGSYTVNCIKNNETAIEQTTVSGEKIKQATVSTENLELRRTAATVYYQLKATPADGAVFKGWYDGNDKLLSSDQEYKLKTSASTDIYAKFEKNIIDGNYKVSDKFFDDLGEAIKYAQNDSCDLIIMKKDAEITGNYTIPAGITLQIPYDDQEILYTDEPASTRDNSEAVPYRILTMKENATLNVQGSLNIGGRNYATMSREAGRNVGGYGLISMDEGSQIVVNDGGTLYAWGFISGKGTVNAELGATVYEYFQISDFRGGTATEQMENGVFPFSQYYVQNIETAIIFHKGANEIVRAGLYLSSGSSIQNTSMDYIGDNGLFKIISGTLTKNYDESTDRVIYMIDGESELNSLCLSVNVLMFELNLNSANYDLPISNNTTLSLKNGSKLTINQDVALLPGVEVYINEGANLIIAEGKKIYLYDSDEWMSGNFVNGAGKFRAIGYTHSNGTSVMRTESNLVDAKICVNGKLTAEGEIYTTAGGANIYSTGDGQYVQTKEVASPEICTYQYTEANPMVLHEIPISLAMLRNSDGSYVASPAKAETITYAEGKWTHSGTAESVSGKAATCTGTGLTDGTKCSVCGETLSGLEEIPVADHNWDGGEITTEATCTADGVKTYNCTSCTEKKTETVKSEGHSWESGYTVDQKATCTSAGKESIHCSKCKETQNAREIQATDHSYGAWKTTEEATCTKTGSREHECSACGHKETETISALGHDIVNHEAKAPTCTAVGWDAYDTCTRCDYTTYAEKSATGHTEVVDAAVAATCTATGLTEGKHCSVCKDVLVAQTVTKAAGHSWDSGKITTEATCTADGIKTYNCTNCTATKEETVKATGHNWSEDYTVDQKATCTSEGSKSKHCKNNCGQTTDTQVIEATGHSYGEWTTTKAATCTEAGSKAHKCTKCGNEETETISALGHDIEHHAAQAPTCTEKGWDAYDTCERCEYTTYVEQAATGHTEVVDSAVPATCTATGLTEGKHCSLCNEILTAQSKVEALGHNWNTTYTVDQAATCTATGTESIHCSACSETKDSRTIAATGHTYVDNKCTSCGATRTITSGGGGGGGAAAVVTVPTTPTTETIVSKEENKTAGEKATTTAIVESKVTNEKVTATVNVETSQKLIEKAVENKSAEVVLEIQTDKTAKTAEVTVPTQAITEIIEKTEADLVIKTGKTQITLDKTGIEELAEKAGTTEAVKIEVNTVESKESVCQVNIEFATSSGKKVDIEKGKVSVTVTPSAELFKKSIVCVYIDENGIYHKVKGQKNADNTYTFIADKF